MFYNKSKHVKKEEQEKETDMNGIMIVLTLLSGVALFLYGMSLMGDGLKRVANACGSPCTERKSFVGNGQ